MKYLLDTNFCIHLLDGSNSEWVTKFLSMGPGRFAVSSIVQAELEYGARKSQRVAANLDRVRRFLGPLENMPFDSKAAMECGDIRATLERIGTPIGPIDLIIAATARANNLVVLTRNMREFARVPGLLVDSW